MLDYDPAELYGVETRVLKQAGRRNIRRFPIDFTSILEEKEFEEWRSQIVITQLRQDGIAAFSQGFC